jgi:hypothetical protein
MRFLSPSGPCRSSSVSMATTLYERQRVEWLWKSNADPFSKTKLAEWSRYSDIENAIIEEAYMMKKSHAILDDYHIDFEHQVQIGNDDKNNQRPVKRVEMARGEERLREARFMPDPIAPASSFHDLIGFRVPFIESAMELLNESLGNWENQKREIVEKAMVGILNEGKLAGKQCEAKWLVEQLDKVKEKTKKEIGECCVYLYSVESFLYKVLNQTMRLVGDKDHEHVWRSKIETLSPFAFILYYYMSFENLNRRTNRMVFRGAQLSDEMIAEYQRVAKSKDPRRSFQAFTSCSRNRAKAEQFGNVLFVIKAENHISYRTLNMNIASLSAYPDEEEVLIRPGRAFKIESVEFNGKTQKYVINLTTIATNDKN